MGEELRSIRARWVVGADGANSFVREARGIARRDLGFRERWLVVDLEPHDMDALDLPPACQWCDPRAPHHARAERHPPSALGVHAAPRRGAPPTSTIPRGPGSCSSPWFTPADGTLTRHAVYEFRSMLAERMRDGRALLVGDAAHLTPPFLGQGLCSGLRDAANVAWKLDLVLRGVADGGAARHGRGGAPAAERVGHQLRRRARAGAMRARPRRRPPSATRRCAPPERRLRPSSRRSPAGCCAAARDGAPGPLAGHLSVQGRVATASGEALLDDVTGGGFTLIAAAGDPLEALDAARPRAARRARAHVVSLDPDADCGRRDARRAPHRLAARARRARGPRAPRLLRVRQRGRRRPICPRSSTTCATNWPSRPLPDYKEPPMSDTAVVHPKFHHFNLKTTRLQEMIDWYGAVVGAEVLFQDATGAWLCNDERQPPRRAARVPRLRGRPGEGHPHGHAPQRLRVRELRRAQRQLPAAARGGDRAGHLHRPRDDVLLLLQGPRRQPRRAAVRQLRRLGGLKQVDADQRGVPRQPDRASSSTPRRSPTPRPPARRSPRSTARAMADEFAPAQAPVEIPSEG